MYAGQQDIEDRYGADALLLVADRDGDGQADPDVVAQAVADADAEIDAYLAARYQLPLSTVPTVLKRLAADLLMYRLATTADLLTEEKRQRYEDAVKLLDRISKGSVSLGLAAPPSSSAGSAVRIGPDRRMTRDSLGKIL
jgi:phage gp36-like protein